MGLEKFLYQIMDKFIKEKSNIIHAETIIIDNEWENHKKLLGKGNIWFILTPANFAYCKNLFNLKMDK